MKAMIVIEHGNGAHSIYETDILDFHMSTEYQINSLQTLNLTLDLTPGILIRRTEKQPGELRPLPELGDTR